MSIRTVEGVLRGLVVWRPPTETLAMPRSIDLGKQCRWLEVMQRQACSGLSVPAFCRRHRLVLPQSDLEDAFARSVGAAVIHPRILLRRQKQLLSPARPPLSRSNGRVLMDAKISFGRVCPSVDRNPSCMNWNAGKHPPLVKTEC